MNTTVELAGKHFRALLTNSRHLSQHRCPAPLWNDILNVGNTLDSMGAVEGSQVDFNGNVVSVTLPKGSTQPAGFESTSKFPISKRSVNLHYLYMVAHGYGGFLHGEEVVVLDEATINSNRARFSYTLFPIGRDVGITNVVCEHLYQVSWVPAGRQSELVFPDGNKIVLNRALDEVDVATIAHECSDRRNGTPLTQADLIEALRRIDIVPIKYPVAS